MNPEDKRRIVLLVAPPIDHHQTKADSALESVTNTVLGLIISIFVQKLIYPLFGFELSYPQSAGIALTFTAISFVRTYCVRRFFNSIA